MPAEKAINKVVYGSRTLIDLTGDTAVENKVLSGYTFHKADGTIVTGSCTFDANTQDATATVGEVLNSKTFYKGGQKLVGTMANIGAQTSSITTKAQEVGISQGYHDGSGKVSIDVTEQNKIISGNIRNGVEILGVTGSYTGSELIKATTLSATPYTTSQTILPSDKGDYDYFTQVSIAAIAYSESDNAAGGKTATIGTVAPA